MAALPGSEFGDVNPLSTIVYALVGAAALVLIPYLFSSTPERAD